jgi:tetratricopeptide (TPR) repeat protein
VLKSKLPYVLLGLVVGFAVGFYVANRANRSEFERLRAEATPRASAGTNAKTDARNDGAAPAPQKTSLSDDELKNVITKADASPANLDLQRKVGEGLYLYATQFSKPDLLPDALRILKRAQAGAPQDYELLVALGNVEFDLARASDTAHFKEARAYYARALAQHPDDINVRTDMGLTYFFDNPSDPHRAIQEYRKSLAQDPRHEMTLQNLAAALIATGELTEAEQRLTELQNINAANPALGDLRAQLAQQRNAAGGQK